MKLKLFFLCFVLMFFVFGCDEVDEDGFGSVPAGVEVSFLNGMPRDSLNEGASFRVGVGLLNNADVDLSGELCALSLLEGYGGFGSKKCQSFEVVAGKSAIGLKPFESDDVYMLKGKDVNEIINLRATYGIDTKIRMPPICVKLTTDANDVECKSSETFSGSVLSSPSLPITLTNVEKIMSAEEGGVRLSMDLTLKKKSGGYVVNSVDDEEQSLKNNIYVEVIYGSYGNMACDVVKNGLIEWKRDENEKVIKCEMLLLGVKDLEESSLEMVLRYYYRDVSEPKTITIMKLDNGGGY